MELNIGCVRLYWSVNAPNVKGDVFHGPSGMVHVRDVSIDGKQYYASDLLIELISTTSMYSPNIESTNGVSVFTLISSLQCHIAV
jgi:hypothetical protein